MSKNIVEMINALNTQHKYAIADAVHNFEDSGSNYPKAITTTDLQEFLTSKGWAQGGSFTYTVDGTSYTATTTSGFVVPLYPADQFPAGTSAFSDSLLVVPDGVTTIKFLVPELNSKKTAASFKNKINIGKPYCGFAFCSFTNSYIKITEVGGNNQQISLFTCNTATTHGYMDQSALSIYNAHNFVQRKGQNCTTPDMPSITIGSTELTESKLQALLALINQ